MHRLAKGVWPSWSSSLLPENTWPYKWCNDRSSYQIPAGCFHRTYCRSLPLSKRRCKTVKKNSRSTSKVNLRFSISWWMIDGIEARSITAQKLTLLQVKMSRPGSHSGRDHQERFLSIPGNLAIKHHFFGSTIWSTLPRVPEYVVWLLYLHDGFLQSANIDSYRWFWCVQHNDTN